jgi:hypothetical protein
MRAEALAVADLRPANVARRLNLPPSYVLIHRVSTAGIGVLCHLECAGAFRTEVLQWIPGYGPGDDLVPAASLLTTATIHDSRLDASAVGEAGLSPDAIGAREVR